jgi:hypothetical protein
MGYGKQLTFDDALAEIDKRTAGRLRRDASDTETEAALSITETTGPQRRAILAMLHAAEDGLTDYEIRAEAKRTGVPLAWSSASTRRKELVDAGLVVDSGQRRHTSTGRQSTVWKVKHP